MEKILEQATAEKHKLLMSVVNWGEVYYSVMRGASAAMAEQKLKEMDAMPIEIVGADLHADQTGGAFTRRRRKCPTPTALARRWPKSKTPNS